MSEIDVMVVLFAMLTIGILAFVIAYIWQVILSHSLKKEIDQLLNQYSQKGLCRLYERDDLGDEIKSQILTMLQQSGLSD